MKLQLVKVLIRLGFFKYKKRRTVVERKIITVFYKHLFDQNTTLLIAPLSSKKYLKGENIFIILSFQNIKIFNHQTFHNLHIEHNIYQTLDKSFNGEVEKRRLIMEEDITTNIINSLNEIKFN